MIVIEVRKPDNFGLDNSQKLTLNNTGVLRSSEREET